MNAFQKRITLRVLGIHVAIIFCVAIVPFMRGCFTPKPKEIITFVEFPSAPTPVGVQQVAHMADPEPPAPPEPEPAPIPEPVKPKPPPVPKPKTVKPKPKPKPKEPEKPKWKPVDPKKIKIGKKINATPKKPAVSSQEIKKALTGITTSPSTTTVGSPSQFNAYIGSIGTYFRRYWNPPPSASSASGVVVVRISIRKNGQITKRVKIQSSGDSVYDKTVMDAVKAVNTVPKPPSNYPYNYVEVEFRLGD